MISDSIVCCYLYVISKYGYPPPAENTVPYLREMKALGFRAIELEGIRREHLLKMYELRYEIRDTLKELDLTVPYFCVVLPGLSSPDPKIRDENLVLFEKGCEIAELIGARGVLDNAPLPPYQFPEDIPIVRHYDEDVLLAARFPGELEWRKYWVELVSTYRNACTIAEDKNLNYQMHPCMGVLSATTDAFLYFHDAVGKDNLRFNLDTANQFVMKDNLALSLLRLADYIDYIHLSDNRGVKVEHLRPGEGVIGWDTFFETLDRIGFKGHIGLDIGGEESGMKNIEQVYQDAARWVENRRPRK
ncbi:MAG: sugar phosphate isomerase/epimerase [Calditrichia bacterium]